MRLGIYTSSDSTDRGVFAMASSSGATFTVESCVRGYHIYKDIWDATIGEELQCARESNNSNDRYAVAVRKNNAVVGHVPRKISRVCALFLERNGAITCTITGSRRRSADLPQGGMELPCVLAFSGDHSDLLKVKRIMTTLSIQPPPKQASNDEPEQECSDSDTTSNQPLSQEREDPAEAVELDATEQHAKLWMKIEDIHLTEADKLILTEGGQLNDRHVNAAQRLLRAQHPNLKGLSLTMIASRQKLPPNGLQAFFVRGNHWIALSTIDCRPAEVNVYDSLYDNQDADTLSAISQSLEVFRPPVIVNLMNIGKQKGGNDCGLFAVAVLTSLANGVDVTKAKFDQALMRTHLINCIDSKEMTPFPSSSIDTMPTNSIIKTLCL